MSNLPDSPTQTHDTGTHEASGYGRSGGFGRSGKGTLLRVAGDVVAFQPIDTSYEHHVELPAGSGGVAIGRFVRGAIRVRGRKIYSVASGGNFVQPILGSPRIIQGRVLGLDGPTDAPTLYVRAGATFAVELPTGPDTIDLEAGGIATGSIVNVVAWPGAVWNAE